MTPAVKHWAMVSKCRNWGEMDGEGLQEWERILSHSCKRHLTETRQPIYHGDRKTSDLETISSSCHEPLLAVSSHISNYPLSRLSVQTLQYQYLYKIIPKTRCFIDSTPQFRHLLTIAQCFTAGVICGAETANPSGVPGVRVVPLYLSGKFLII
jgi:hypothetical protein